MVHNSYHDIVEEKEFRKDEELFKGINKQRQKQSVIEAIRHKQLAAIQEQHNLSFEELSMAKQMYSHEDFQFRMLEALESTAENMERLVTDTRLKYVRKGEVYGNRFSLTPGQLYQIDIVKPDRSANPLPGNVLFNFASPRRPVPIVKIINEGKTAGNDGSGLLFINTNFDYNNTSQPSLVIPAPPTGSSAVPYVIDTGEPVIERLNFMATQGSNLAITVNIIFET